MIRRYQGLGWTQRTRIRGVCLIQSTVGRKPWCWCIFLTPAATSVLHVCRAQLYWHRLLVLRLGSPYDLPAATKLAPVCQRSDMLLGCPISILTFTTYMLRPNIHIPAMNPAFFLGLLPTWWVFNFKSVHSQQLLSCSCLPSDCICLGSANLDDVSSMVEEFALKVDETFFDMLLIERKHLEHTTAGQQLSDASVETVRTVYFYFR